jgi:chemotaxis protein CheZ
MSSDSEELEALFDSHAQAPATKAPMDAGMTGDTPELESLFESIVEAQSGAGMEVQEEGGVYNQLGHMTRNLHNLLRELGYDKTLEKVASEIPANQDRLQYIATLTEQAASRTLNAAEAAQPVQEMLGTTAIRLSGQWRKMFDRQLDIEGFKGLVSETRGFLDGVPEQTKHVNDRLMEIILAQDFQDLTGQVIKKIVDAVQNVESQMIRMLVENVPEEKRLHLDKGLLNGPVVNARERSDVVTSQEQVDDLLEGLGF